MKIHPHTWRCTGAALCALLSITEAPVAKDPAGTAGRAAPPPAQTVAPVFRNPARCAFRQHTIEAALDPQTAALRATDEIVLVHPAGVPASIRVPFLLNRSLQVRAVEIRDPRDPHALGWEDHQRWEPRDFWEQPEYAELADLGHARQVDLFWKQAGGADTWPESLRVVITYAGSVYDSLRPPPENYQRGFETTSGLIDPRGVYLSGASLWYPQRYDDPFPFQLAVEVPPDWLAVSQGRMAEHHAATRTQVTWISPQPMDEIYLIAGPYRLHQEDYQGVAIQTFTYGNDDEELCARYISATRDYLDLYSPLFGPYPFDKFALVENFWQTGYGMPSFTLLGTTVIRLPWIVSTSYGHEILHNWWGNSTFIDATYGNWCEGLTAYGADYLYKERESPAAAREYRRTTLQGYLDYVRTGRDFPLTEFRERDSASSQAIGYGKSMMVFHMLRRHCGDDLFWKALAKFHQSFLFRSATWKDLLAVFEKLSGENLQAFYDQWIARPGAPLLRLTATDVIPHPASGAQPTCKLTYTLEQTAPTYALAVPMRITFADRPAENWTVALAGESFTETRELPALPRTLEVDPDFDLFRRLHRAEVPAALSQLMGADTLTAVISTGEAPALADAYRSTVAETSAATHTGVRADTDVTLADLQQGGTWLLGEPHWTEGIRELLPAQVVIDARSFRIGEESYDRATHTLVLALPHPTAHDEAVGLMLASAPGEVAAVWRKLPHYGKYSYLVFAGQQNVAKGTWDVGRSPLKVVWDEGR